MDKFTKLSSKVMPLPMRDIDTDLIIPAKFLTTINKTGLADGLFRNLRDSQADFPLNNPKYQGAKILVVDHNFGCGSSREHAVWALKSHGFQVIIAKSFADIFYSNSAKNGLLLITLEENVVESILQNASSGNYFIEVDLEKQLVLLENKTIHNFSYDEFSKHCLLNGLDELDYLLSKQAEIKQFKAGQEKYRFYSTLEINNK